MSYVIQRGSGDANCTPGEFDVGGVLKFYTLEPRKDQSQGKPYCIPAGVYRYKKAMSAHFGFIVPVLQDVPGFEGVEIHPGNAPKDTHGCTLVGDTESSDWVGQSDAAFHALMAILPDEGEIEYLDAA